MNVTMETSNMLIIEIERDRKQAKVGKYLDFARQINNHQNVMQLWGK